LIEQGGVRLDGQPVTTFETTVTPTAGGEVILQVGKRKFLRVQAG